MFASLDSLLLARSGPANDAQTCFKRVDGASSSNLLYFLPWNTPYAIAWRLGLVALPFRACYEMPSGIVSSRPETMIEAVDKVVGDARRIAADIARSGRPVEIVCFSIGAFPGAVVAAEAQARICAIAAADRGDLMLWESPAAADVKRRAIERGYALSDFTEALAGLQPAERLGSVGDRSMFLIGSEDLLVPASRRNAWLASIHSSNVEPIVETVRGGHFATLLASRQAQQRFARGDQPTAIAGARSTSRRAA